MTVLEIIQAAGERTNKQTSQADVKARFLNHLNFARKKAWQKFNWSWKNKVWMFPVSSQITTGTASATNGSRFVTLPSVSITSAQIGWYFQIPSATPAAWYRVVNMSGTTLTIDPAYQGSDVSNAPFYMRGFDWPVPSELEGMPKAVELSSSPIVLESMLTTPTLIPNTMGRPIQGVLWSNDAIGTTYETGTISATVGTRTWTGVSSLWLTGSTPPIIGDQLEITVGSVVYKYRIQAIYSNTAITTYQYAQTTVSASGYVIRNQFNRLLRLSPTPDQPYVIAIHGQRKFYPLAYDNDIDELLDQFDDAIVEGMEAYEMASSPDDREKDKFNRFLLSIAEKIGVDSRNFNVIEPSPIAIPYGAYRA